MLTLFTTTKDFVGQNKFNQINAINSWLVAPLPIKVILFGKSKGIEVFEGEPNVMIYEDINASKTGIPIINHMFSLASQLSDYPICCFLNADIILPNKFFKDIVKIHERAIENYLIVGQRLDVDVTHLIVFKENWEEEFKSQYRNKIEVHLPYGSDFFVFPRGQYNEQNLPAMLVGRVTWDNYMIYDARKKRFKLIDLSESTMVIHQNHDYLHKPTDEIQKKEDEEFNHQFFPNQDWWIYVLDCCNLKFKKNKIVKNYSRGDLNKYLLIKMKFDSRSILAKLLLKLEVFFLKFFKKVGVQFQ